MNYSWLDIILFGIIAIAFILGIAKGLIKQIIGISAVIIGLILAVTYYAHVSDLFSPLVSSTALSQFLGFLAIFLAVLCLGGLISAMLSKLMKGPFKFLNHVVGGGFGLLKGILICGVILFGMLVFPINTKALTNSQLAPFCLNVTRAAFYLVPQDLKEKFSEAYKDIIKKQGKHERKV